MAISYVFEVYKDKASEWRWRLRAPNKHIVADSSEGYKNKKDCMTIVNNLIESTSETFSVNMLNE